MNKEEASKETLEFIEKEKMTGRGFMQVYDAGNLIYIQK